MNTNTNDKQEPLKLDADSVVFDVEQQAIICKEEVLKHCGYMDAESFIKDVLSHLKTKEIDMHWFPSLPNAKAIKFKFAAKPLYPLISQKQGDEVAREVFHFLDDILTEKKQNKDDKNNPTNDE